MEFHIGNTKIGWITNYEHCINDDLVARISLVINPHLFTDIDDSRDAAVMVLRPAIRRQKADFGLNVCECVGVIEDRPD